VWSPISDFSHREAIETARNQSDAASDRMYFYLGLAFGVTPARDAGRDRRSLAKSINGCPATTVSIGIASLTSLADQTPLPVSLIRLADTRCIKQSALVETACRWESPRMISLMLLALTFLDAARIGANLHLSNHAAVQQNSKHCWLRARDLSPHQQAYQRSFGSAVTRDVTQPNQNVAIHARLWRSMLIAPPAANH
jgi:hypothetical protein